METEVTYQRIAEAIDNNPYGAPRVGGEFSTSFLEYLRMLFPPAAAELVQHLTMRSKSRPMTAAADIASLTGLSEGSVRETLDPLADRGYLLGFDGNYALPDIPLLLNAHNFQPEVGPEDLEAARLYQEFFIRDGFYRRYEGSDAGTPVMRVIPVQRAVEHEQRILDSEEAHAIIDACENICMVPCPCRTRTEKMGARECADRYPVGACLMCGFNAAYFQMRGIGQVVTQEQAKAYFDEMQELGLVGLTENYASSNHAVICLCCDCCCSQLRGRTRWDNPLAVAPSNFVPVATDDCVACETCVDRCFFGALSFDEEAGKVVADAEKCIGCGVCTITCAQEALRLARHDRYETFAESGDLYRTVARENHPT